MFDLPVKLPEQRKDYAQFRKFLLGRGFTRMQYSVYARPQPSEDAADHLMVCIRTALPAKGHVRMLMVTDHQYGKMQVFMSKKRKEVEDPPEQYSLF